MVRIFVGVAWPYANGPFHIGHLSGAYLPGDEFARYHRLRGDEVLLVSGSDMHGTPILVTAEKEGVSPETIARRFHAVNKESFERLGVSFDLFTHTHTVEHERTVQELFLRLLERGLIVRKTEANAYCPKHQRFLPDRYLVGVCPHCGFESARGDECDRCGRVLEPRQLGHPRCSLDGTEAEFRPSEHFYLDLSQLQAPLERFLHDRPQFRDNVRGVAANFLAGGLRPTAITRDLDWGIPIPLEGYESKRFYVWFDAVIGYLSAAKEWAVRAGRPAAWERYWKEGEPVRSYYFIGKDNVFHHTLIWPGILLGVTGLVLPFDVPANEWMLVQGGKISKSRTESGAAFIPALLAQHSPDVIRFYATLLAPENHDTEFDPGEFERLSEEILSNQYGNLAQRALVLTREREGARVPDPPEGWSPDDSEVARRLHEKHREITDAFEAVHLKEALDLALGEVREANRRFHESRPWRAADPERRRSLYETLWALKAAAVWLAPVLPFSSAELFRMLGYAEAPGPGDWDEAIRPVPAGQPLGDVRALFPRPSDRKAPATPSAVGAVDTPPPLEIRAAKIRSVVPHPSADRLYVLQLDLGAEPPRTVVAGLRAFYAAEQLEGRTVALLANLEPRVIRKVASQGMILAAEAGERVAVLPIPVDVPPGAVAGRPSGGRTISIDEFARAPLVVGRARASDGELRTWVDVGGREVSVAGSFTAGQTIVLRLRAPDSALAEAVLFEGGPPLSADAELPPGSRIR